MMRKISIFLVALFLFPSLLSSANLFDEYLSGEPIFVEIGNNSDGIVSPTDLDFNLETGRESELWIMNQVNRNDNFGGSTVMFTNPGTETQESQYEYDMRGGHFLIRASSIAFGDKGTWASAHAVRDANGNPDPNGVFCGPTMWSSDLSIYARIGQTQWGNPGPNGSHLDMVHQTPYGMGIAHEADNIFWVYDGWSGNIIRYDFKEPHEPGGDYHGDAVLHRFTEVEVGLLTDVPSHIDLDKESGWLYIVDGENKRILRMNINTGSKIGDLPHANGEPLAELAEYTGVEWEVLIDSGLDTPCGIDYHEGRIVVSDNATGEIIIYDVSGDGGASEMGRINTGEVSIMGVKVGPEGHIWYVDYATNRLVRIDSEGASSLAVESSGVAIAEEGEDLEFTVKNNSEGEVEFSVELTVSNRTPNDWTASLDADKISVAAGESANIPVRLTPGATLGIGDVTARVWVEGNSDFPELTKTITAVSDNIRFLSVNNAVAGNQNRFSLDNLIETSGYDYALAVDPDTFRDMVRILGSIETFVWTFGSFGMVSSNEALMLENLLDNGSHGLIVGDQAVNGLGRITFPSSLEEVPNLDFLAKFGAAYRDASDQGFSTGGQFTLGGIEGDPISDGMANIAANLTLFNFQGQNAAISLPLLYPIAPTGEGMLYVGSQTDSLVATRIETDTYRAVALGVNPANISNETQRNLLMKRTLDWLIGGGTSSVEPTADAENQSLRLEAGPNPFNDETSITFTIKDGSPQQVRLVLLNSLGQEVAVLHDGIAKAGSHSVKLSDNNLAAGNYYALLTSPDSSVFLQVVRLR